MTFTYTRFLSRLSTPVLKKHVRKFTHLYSGVKQPPPATSTLRRCFCEKPVDPYAAINQDDFEIFEPAHSYLEVDFESIAEGDPETIKALKLLQLEIDIYAQEGGTIPSKLTADDWLELVSLPNKSQRRKQLRFIASHETRKLNRKKRQEILREEFGLQKIPKLHLKDLTTSSPLEYGLMRTSLFHRFYDQQMKNLYNFKLFQASMFGPHLVIDCGYDEFMNRLDVSACTKDILRSWSDNREHFYPFDIMFCNVNRNSKILEKLSEIVPGINSDPANPFNITDKSYLDMFPKEKLIYLTPYCTEVMKDYESDCVYIIGGVWDKSRDAALSLAKAKKEGLRRYKFPLDDYMKWKMGKKTLKIAECVGILNDLKDGRSWDFALRNIKNRQERKKTDLYDDGRVIETNTRTSAHFEELDRRKNIYDMLLTRKSKKKKSE